MNNLDDCRASILLDTIRLSQIAYANCQGILAGMDKNHPLRKPIINLRTANKQLLYILESDLDEKYMEDIMDANIPLLKWIRLGCELQKNNVDLDFYVESIKQRNGSTGLTIL